MRKQDAIEFFGGVVKTAAAMEIRHSTVSEWPDPLPLSLADRVRGAALRLEAVLKKKLPPHMRRG